MKKLLATVCVLGLVAGLAACSSEGEGYKDEAPYAQERTVGAPEQPAEPAKAEKVFRASQVK